MRNSLLRVNALAKARDVVWPKRIGDTALPGVHQRQWLVTLVVLLMSSGLLSGAAGGTERARPFLIGALTAAWGHTPAVTGLRDGLRDLGYRENEQFVIGVRFTQGDLGALPAAARELVEQRVDLIFASGQSAKAAQAASTQIPIVFAGEADPLGMGLIQSFARPGGNITGVASLGVELGAKRLEVFREVIPGLQRLLFPPTIRPIPTPSRRGRCTVTPPTALGSNS